MRRKNWGKKSVIFKLTLYVIILITVQACLLTVMMIVGGVLSQGEEDAYESFYAKISNRNNYIQREMKNRWTKMDPYVSQIARGLREDQKAEEFFEKAVQDLIALLRNTQATGVFIILEENEQEKAHPALYVRDYDPLLNDYTNRDLYLVAGPADIAKDIKIPLDQYWKHNIKLDASNRDFYDKPYLKAPLTLNASLLGYWSLPFKLFEEDAPIITYTIPFFDTDNRIRGVIGIEISVSYLSQFLPATDLSSRDSLGYMIGFKEQHEDKIQPILMTGALQKRMIDEKEPLILKEVDSRKNIYVIENHKSKEAIYACAEKLGLYSYNTPFQTEEWYLIGMMTEEHLLKYVLNIKGILWSSLISSIFIGIIGGYFISYSFTKPIVKLAKQVKDSHESMALETTGLLEVDQLAGAIITAHNALLESTAKMSRIIDLVDVPIGAFEYEDGSEYVFATDQLQHILSIKTEEMSNLLQKKGLFIKKLNEILDCPEEEEEGVYALESLSKWIKIKTIRNKTSILGIVMDVTHEILEKKKIKEERDYDPLTKIYNRKAVQRHIEMQLETTETLKTAALLMLDLDNLKLINDTYGHKWGDIYIKTCVEYLKKINKGYKILGRRSGDEFVLFLYAFSSKEELRKAVKDFYKNLEREPLSFPDGEIKPITISSGLMWIEDTTFTYDELLQRADEALYKAKRADKGTCQEVKI